MAAATQKNETAKNNDKPKAAAPPSDFTKETTDVVGYWDGDKRMPLLGVPQFVNLMDSNIDEYKPTALIFVRVSEDTQVQSAEGEGKIEDRPTITAKAGDLVGVWFSGGMRDIAMAAGRPTWMLQTGEKDVGKPSKMKVYDVRCKKGTQPKLIPVREDRRKSSAGVNAAPFCGPKKAEKSDTGDAGDDMPF